MNEMKRYVNTVERCLRLDPATRLRVMNDLASDLQSRLEAGETMEQIRAELGGPEQLAAALEAEFAAHRDPAPRWRWWLLAGAAAVLAAAAFGSCAQRQAAASVGIIGGADGPTAIFVSGPVAFPGWWPLGLVWAVLLVAAFLLLGWCRHGRPRRCWLPAALCTAVLVAEGALAVLGRQLVPALVLSPLTALAGLLLSGAWLAAVLLVLAVRGALKK